MSAKTIPQSLTKEQMDYMNSGALVLLSTIHRDTQTPSTTAISWVKAVSENKIRFSVTNNSRTFANLRENPCVSLTMIGLGTVYSIVGTVHVLEEKIEGIGMPLAKLEIDIQAVFESMFWGAKVQQSPTYVKTYDLEKAAALDQQVYAALFS